MFKNLSIYIAILLVVIFISCQNQYSPLDPSVSTENNGNSAEEENSSAYTLNDENENIILSCIAKQMAKLSKSDEFRLKISQLTINSQVRENIIPLELFLEEDLAGLPIGKLIADGEEKVKIEQILTPERSYEKMLTQIKCHPTGFDVYFPVETHRQTLIEKSSENFLVAFVNLKKQKDDLTFPAWDFNGTEILLSTKEVPTKPVLVITQCEHNGLCRLDASRQNFSINGDSEQPPALKKPAAGVLYKLDWCEIFDDHEPWNMGAPEIYFLTTLYANGSTVGYQSLRIPEITGEGDFDFDPNISLVWSPNFSVSSAKIEVKEDDGSWGTDWLERYGGWNLGSDTGVWMKYVSVVDYWLEWHGDDDDCDIISRGEWYW